MKEEGLNGIKVGDRVAHYHYWARPPAMIGTVKKVTKTQVTTNTHRYFIHNGRMFGGRHFARKLTPEIEMEILEEKKQEQTSLRNSVIA